MWLAFWRFAFSILTISCLAISEPSRAQEGEDAEGEGNPDPVGIRGGKSDFRFGDLLGAQGANTSAFFLRNDTQERFKDFELELTGCGPAKFRRVKVYPKARFNEKGELEADSRSDWDVDDDGSGLSDQQLTPDPGAKQAKTPGMANETDNVDDSPDTKTRVDANGGSGGSEERHAQAMQNARQAKTEDADESKPGDPGSKGKEPLDGDGGVQPGDSFLVEFELTEAEKGDECVASITPSGVGGRQIAALDTGAKPGLAPGQEYAAVPGGAPIRAGTGVEFAFTPGGSFASIGTEQTTNFNGTTHGKDIDYAAANLHGDLRYYWSGLAEGRTGWFRPALIVGLKGAGSLGGADRGLEEDNHPPAGIESFVDYEIDGTLTPFFGLTLADFDCSRVNFLVGPRITFAEITAITDESGGGGVRERFSRNVVQVGPAFGVELDVPIRPLSREGFEVGVRVAGWGEYLPGTHVTGESSTFPFDYRFETEGAWVGTVRGGVFLRWGL